MSAADTPALPEVLIVIDSSASMQYALHADKAPTCGSSDPAIPDQKSRWIAAREIVGGSFIDYKCKTEPLSPLPEAVNPPKQIFGALMCIPGLAHVVGTPYTVDPTTGTGSTSASGAVRWSGETLTTGNLDDAPLGTRTIPWVRFDLASIPSDKAWVGGAVAVADTGSLGVGLLAYATLVLSPVDPKVATPKEFLCANDSVHRKPMSLPTQVVYGSGQQTVFSLTDEALKTLRDLKIAGKAAVHFAIVPSESLYDAACLTLTGAPKLQKIQWHGAGSLAAERPQLLIQAGEVCAGEGPTTHAVASGINDLGLPSSQPNGKDGLLDLFGPSAKFGLLAADGVLSQATTPQGGFTFGPALASYWGDVNLGVADPGLDGSPSVRVTGPDTLPARVATYAAMQSALEKARPNGPTPLGAQLDDVLHYLGPGPYMDPHFKTVAEDPVNGDPYLACRNKIVVVLSDGGANLYSGGSNGRAKAIQAAAALYARNIPVYVLAVGHHAAPGESGPSAADKAFLDEVAAAGGTQSATAVTKPAEAIAVLTPAIAESTLVGQVLTRPNYTLATGLAADVQHSFYALSNYDISQPLRTRGILEQRIFRCDAACKAPGNTGRGQVCDVIEYDKRLLTRPVPRRLYTHKDGARLDVAPANLTPFDLGIGTVGVGPKLELMPDGSCVTTQGYNLSLPFERAAYRDHVLETLRGAKTTCREKHPLGAPSRSQPTVLESADRLALRDGSFVAYAKTTVPTSANYTSVNLPGSAGRPTMLFAATHDGLLHAFRTDRNPKITVKDDLLAGDELWAFLPRFNHGRVSQMKLVTEANASYLGGSVTAQHVLLERKSLSLADAAKQWRAVVVVGAGEAGSGYVALDVTAPDDPRLLWEITPDQHCFGSGTVTGVTGPKCVPTKTFQAMGRSTARPVIASLFYKKANVLAERAVVILPLGKPPGDATVANLGVEGLGQRGVFVVELATGALVRAFTAADLELDGMTADGADPDALGHHWSDIACYNTVPGQLVTRCFQGDSKGMVWRVDLSATEPAKWQMHFFKDAYSGADTPIGLHLAADSPDRVPVLSPPSLAANRDGRLTVVFGTGSVDEPATVARKHVVYSLGEAYTLLGNGAGALPKASRNWVKSLGNSERFVGPPLVFANNAYWASYTLEQAGACAIGAARFWGAHFDRRQAASDPTDLLGAFPNPDKPASPKDNVDFVDVGAFQPSPVTVQPVPACQGACPPSDAKCVAATGGQLGGSKPKYELGIAVAAKVQGQYQAPKNGVPPPVGTVTRDIAQPRSAAIVTGWDLLLD